MTRDRQRHPPDEPPAAALTALPVAASLGRWIKQRRKALDLTQAALANRMGYALSTVRKLEAGELRLSRAAADRLVQALGIARDDLPAGLPPAPHQAARRPPAAQHTPAPQPLLPHTAVPLIGRAAEVALVSQQLLGGVVRLVTLSGPPGIGKTRLAIHLAGAVQAAFAGGVTLIALDHLTDSAQVLPTIARHLAVAEQPGVAPVTAIQAAIGSRPRLLILDTLEHLGGAAADLAALIAACPGVTILATSQTRLGIAGEQVVLLPPLVWVPPTATDPPEADAVALFATVARLSAPQFVVTPGNRAAVTAICARVDGLPLAIELVASRSTVLSPAALLARLDASLIDVPNRRRDCPPRHRTLRAAMTWSYDLLGADEQRVFRRLGVVAGRGSSALAAALTLPEDAAAPPIAVLLACLEARSLLQVQRNEAGESWFTLHALVRAYALEQLTRAGERPRIEARYAAACARGLPHEPRSGD